MGQNASSSCRCPRSSGDVEFTEEVTAAGVLKGLPENGGSASSSGIRERRPPTKLKNGAEYSGEWLGHYRDGQGCQVWPDDGMYKGQWSMDKAHGKGKFSYSDGDVYEGDWVNDKAHGEGVYHHTDGSVYEGQWVEDRQHGIGVEVYPDGAKYSGQYRAGRKHGVGKFAWSDKSVYQGEFKDNSIHGEGVYTWSNGRRYDGQWVKNRMHGKGNFTWSDGRSYDGEYSNDQKDGHGIFKWPDGRQYDGQWKDGKQHGTGTFSIQHGEVQRIGSWENGRRTHWVSNQQSRAQDAANVSNEVVGVAPTVDGDASRLAARRLGLQEDAIDEACVKLDLEATKQAPLGDGKRQPLSTAVQTGQIFKERKLDEAAPPPPEGDIVQDDTNAAADAATAEPEDAAADHVAAAPDAGIDAPKVEASMAAALNEDSSAMPATQVWDTGSRQPPLKEAHELRNSSSPPSSRRPRSAGAAPGCRSEAAGGGVAKATALQRPPRPGSCPPLAPHGEGSGRMLEQRPGTLAKRADLQACAAEPNMSLNETVLPVTVSVNAEVADSMVQVADGTLDSAASGMASDAAAPVL